jgi:CubicO group peptidase (beta-lactamase class C family)
MKINTLIKTLHAAFLCLLVFAISVQVSAQEGDKASKLNQVNKLFESTSNSPVPGASVIVIDQGNIVQKQGYGLANIEKKVPNTPETIFRLGSITKQFTALAIMQLHDKQELQIDDPIGKYFPGTLNGDRITIQHLLTHTSGISESLDSDLEFAPGDQLSYSNTGYNLLGKLIEKVSGLSYENYLQQYIFKPLGMNHSGYEHPNAKAENSAVGYAIGDDGSYINLGDSDVSNAYAAGALYSTVEDMYLWDQALNSEELVKKGTLNQAFTPVTLNNGSKASYGFGWMLNQWHGLKEVGHGGDITGFNSYIARFPEEQFTVIVLSNVQMNPPGPLANAGDLAHKIAEIYLSGKMSSPSQPVAIQLDSKILETYVGQYELVDAPPEILEVTGNIFTVRKMNNQLFLRSKVGEGEIHAESETQFFIPDNTTIKFTIDDGEVMGLVMDLMGLGIRILNAKKIQ